MREVSQIKQVKVVNYVKRKTGSKGKANLKKHSRTSHDVQFKEFSLTKLDLKRTMGELGKNHFWKKIRSKNKKKQKISVKMPHVNKKITSENLKFGSNKKVGLEWTINAMRKPLRKNPIQKIEKSRVKLPHVNKKPLARKWIFVHTPFSHSTLKLEQKIHAAKLAFSLHFLFRRDQNHYSNLTSKIMEMCEQILKKKTAPQYNSNSLNCKKNESA